MTKKEYMKIYMAVYRKTEKNKKYHREYISLWRKKNGTRKDSLRRAVSEKIKQGLIQRLPCKVCKEKKVEAHHDDYRSPIIVWLCQKHHRERDVLIGKRKS